MIDDAPQSCSPNEFIAFKCLFKFLRPAERVCLSSFVAFPVALPFLSCSHVAFLSLLSLWHGEVPGSILGTLPHGAHQPGEAHIFGFLQPTHQPLLHNGYELLITKLPVP